MQLTSNIFPSYFCIPIKYISSGGRGRDRRRIFHKLMNSSAGTFAILYLCLKKTNNQFWTNLDLRSIYSYISLLLTRAVTQSLAPYWWFALRSEVYNESVISDVFLFVERGRTKSHFPEHRRTQTTGVSAGTHTTGAKNLFKSENATS